jgi:hypothetical protein
VVSRDLVKAGEIGTSASAAVGGLLALALVYLAGEIVRG